eukprot:gene13651-19536_t
MPEQYNVSSQLPTSNSLVADARAVQRLLSATYKQLTAARAPKCLNFCKKSTRARWHAPSPGAWMIGQRSVASSSTKLLFTTAGLLLEDLRANGAASLAGCKFMGQVSSPDLSLEFLKRLMVHERSVEPDLSLEWFKRLMVHERSVESDLSLECLKRLMLGNKSLQGLKLVLMSATADIDRFRAHFKDLAVKLDVINISDSNMLLRNVLPEFEVEEKYLHHAVVYLKKHSRPELQERHADMMDRAVGPDMLQLISDLVKALHEQHLSGPAAHHVVLVFLPTYKALESLYQLLRAQGDGILDVYALHSTLDTEECLRNMEVESVQSANQAGEGLAAGPLLRKVIIATNIAESSITIKGVAWVIDTCVTNEIAWSEDLQVDAPSVVWASHSQCRQRKGRTGRTGGGTVYRLMLRNSY